MVIRNLLLVEGKDDENVIRHLAKFHLPQRVVYGSQIDSATLLEEDESAVFIKEKGSITNLIRTLYEEVDRSDLLRLGIIVDADETVESRWQQLSDKLNKIGYRQVPGKPLTEGTIIQERELPTVGIWVMPNNLLSGKLEDFLTALIADNDVLWPKAQQDVAAIPTEHRKFSELDTIKAKLHTWLAWQEEPGRPYGIAIRAKFLDANAPHAQEFMNWLNKLLTV